MRDLACGVLSCCFCIVFFMLANCVCEDYVLSTLSRCSRGLFVFFHIGFILG